MSCGVAICIAVQRDARLLSSCNLDPHFVNTPKALVSRLSSVVGLPAQIAELGAALRPRVRFTAQLPDGATRTFNLLSITM